MIQTLKDNNNTTSNITNNAINDSSSSSVMETIPAITAYNSHIENINENDSEFIAEFNNKIDILFTPMKSQDNHIINNNNSNNTNIINLIQREVAWGRELR
jgi:hypothetical protein